MAAVGVATASDPLLGISADYVRPDFHQTDLAIERFLHREKNLRTSSDDQICQLALLPPGCPLGPEHCPLRHVTDLPPKPPEKKSDVCCRHWLRGICKLGPELCPFLHYFNLRDYPECWLWSSFGRCAIGSECLYYHKSEADWRVLCPDYERGFCPLGPTCPREHRRKNICPAYAFGGYCPDGKNCKGAHPPPNRPPPEKYVNPIRPNPEDFAGPLPAVPSGYGRSLRAFDPTQTVVQDRTAQLGGALSAWREGGGMLSVNARRNDQEPPPRRNDRGDRPKKWVSEKDMGQVLCFRCNQYGHFANNCPNDAVPGQRGPPRNR